MSEIKTDIVEDEYGMILIEPNHTLNDIIRFLVLKQNLNAEELSYMARRIEFEEKGRFSNEFEKYYLGNDKKEYVISERKGV